jgi:hypothetical protein
VDELPEWKPGTAAILSVRGPHAIPISTAVRLAGDRLAFALARTRETLDRLRGDSGAALTVLAGGLAFTAYGSTEVRGALEASDRVVAVVMQVDRIQDHLEGARTEILAAPDWRWTNDEAAETDAAIRAELSRLV